MVDVPEPIGDMLARLEREDAWKIREIPGTYPTSTLNEAFTSAFSATLHTAEAQTYHTAEEDISRNPGVVLEVRMSVRTSG